MSLELWNTIFAGATFVVIAATAIAALVQLRHLRNSNELNALLTLMEMWQEPGMQEHIKYTRTTLREKLQDPEYLSQYNKFGLSRVEHPEMLVADFWEQIGTFMKHQLFDESAWLDIAAAQAARSWADLEPIIRTMQAAGGPSAYENFEYLAVRATLWQARHPLGAYPAGLPRMRELTRSNATRNSR